MESAVGSFCSLLVQKSISKICSQSEQSIDSIDQWEKSINIIDHSDQSIGNIIFLEWRDDQGERLVPDLCPLLGPGPDVDPDVHLPVLLLVVDPPGQGGEGELEACHTVFTPGHRELHIPAVFLTEIKF